MPMEAKKIVIKGFDPLKSKQRQEKYYNVMIQQLDIALQVIMAGLGLKTGYQELYSGVENLTKASQASRCFTLLQNHFTSGIQLLTDACLASISHKTDDINACSIVVRHWKQWMERVETVQNVFYYMDKTFLAKSSDFPTVEDFALSLFRDKLLASKAIQVPFLNDVLKLYEDIHCAKPIDRSCLQEAMSMLHRVKSYSPVFVPMYLVFLNQFYESQSEDRMKSLPMNEYLMYVQQCLDYESVLINEFDLVRHQNDILQTLQKRLIQSHLSTLVNGIQKFVQERDLNSCKLLYSLLQLTSETSQLVQPWSECLTEIGFQLVNDEKNEDHLVPNLLSLHTFLQSVVENAFSNDEALSYAMRKSFETFINGASGKRREAPAKSIAKYIDYLLRYGEQVTNGTPLQQIFETLLDIFRYVSSKDVFEAFYKRDIAKRLLLNKSASSQNERMLLEMLKRTCGSQFTHALEGMFKDINLSKEFSSSFKQSKLSKNLHRDLYVNVLSQAYWPSYPEGHVRLPGDMQEDLQQFEKFYLTKQTSKQIRWLPSLGHCLVKARFPLGNKELSISLFQACVLLEFNRCASGEGITYRQLQKSTELSDADLTRTLQSLSCTRVRPLLMDPKGKVPKPDTTFYVNEEFTDKLYRIKINQIYLKDERQESEEVQEQVVQDRQFELQATVVRIMKQKERLRHDQLVHMTIESSKDRGVPPVSDVKSTIEKLINKEYLERAENDEYVYVS
ncbi:Cullin 4 [Schizosaccharomyces cryophilus OY26]|uniref:Cullin 4 n=1 Tax=Schizosaccharomyces cryophilus (strain OY26 / ATCC MYA-4695 / CBS 11777 / NBRC 106824 / NRRL Y48691) TaxID=653667 RepID=S9W2N3_SCHCR|nr:Cullin 4 [Schizosaccharomyces cryophilus OY26]EPY52724.1 Cullin 4 [Schizosaccharomyces cryophilus OY26]